MHRPIGCAVVVAIAAPTRADTAIANHRAPLDWRRMSGITAEIDVGIGGIEALVADHSGTPPAHHDGFRLDAGIGAFLDRRVAASLRATSVTTTGDGVGLTAGFVGAASQAVFEHAWVGIGIGLAFAIDRDAGDIDFGLGTDLRVGYMLRGASEHAIKLSLGATLGHYGGGFLLGYGLTIGYQRI